MTTEELNAVADTLSTVYRKRGYILVDDVQSKLDEFGASLVDTTRLIALLEERGCGVSEKGDSEDDISMYDGSLELIPDEVIKKLTSFYLRDSKAGIPGLPFSLIEYNNGLLYYAYLRIELGLTKSASTQNIITLQETYDIFLPEGEHKAIFDIISASYIQSMMDTIHNRKKYKRIRAVHKNALGTYQMFLTLNRHRVIAFCESRL